MCILYLSCHLPDGLASSSLQMAISFLPPVASAPTNLMAVQEGSTGIRVSWTPPTPLGDTTGYRIYYSGGGSDIVDVSGGSIDNHLLTGLQNGASYTISIVGTSEHLPSDHVDFPTSIPLSEFLQCVSTYLSCRQMVTDNLLKPSSWPAKHHCQLNNSHHHLPLLECSQWLSGGQL